MHPFELLKRALTYQIEYNTYTTRRMVASVCSGRRHCLLHLLITHFYWEKEASVIISKLVFLHLKVLFPLLLNASFHVREVKRAEILSKRS